MLESVDLQKKEPKASYARKIAALQERLRTLQYAARDAEIPILLCLEGWDTAGKGQVIRKLTEKLDPRLFRVYSGSRPSPLEQRYHFLWRYELALPNDGEMAIFDHSWYGRVLVERCDKLVPKKLWREAYEQINQLERWLTDDGQVLLKFWLHISKAEQKKRFRKCLADPLLKWKITKEYRRHHAHYAAWVKAIEEMLAKTSTPQAPWIIVEANDIHWARVRVFETLVERVEAELARRQSQPALVSRTAAAAGATVKARAQRAAKDAHLANAEKQTTLAAEAGHGASRKPKAERAHA